MRLTKKFYEISKSLDTYHRDLIKEHYSSKCVHCKSNNTISSESILCKRCNTVFHKIHDEDISNFGDSSENVLWRIAARSKDFKEFKLNVVLSRLDNDNS